MVDRYEVNPYEVREVAAGEFVISHTGSWIPGIYVSAEAAVEVAEHFADNEIEELFGPIYTVEGENRPVTLVDYRRVMDERGEDATTGEAV